MDKCLVKFERPCCKYPTIKDNRKALLYYRCILCHGRRFATLLFTMTTLSCYTPSAVDGGGGSNSDMIKFHEVVQVVESDNRVTTRHMNPDGGISRTDDDMYDDSISMDLDHNEGNEMSFLDAVERYACSDDENDLNFFQTNRFVH